MKWRTGIAALLFGGGCIVPHGAAVTGVDSDGWRDTARISFVNEDTAVLRDMDLFVRHDSRFRRGFVSAEIIVAAPDSTMTAEHVLLHFGNPAEARARRQESAAPYRRRTRLARLGEYRIMIVPDSTVRGVEAVGVNFKAGR